MAARNSGFAPFRGTWLADDTFLNTDVLEESPDDVQFLACKVCACSVLMKIHSNLKKGRN